MKGEQGERDREKERQRWRGNLLYGSSTVQDQQ